MAPAAAASLLSATSSKRPAAPSDANPILQGDQLEEEARKNHHHHQQLDCPRCGSGNTKFCYYNNYSTAQPRHFCRACRRYWTHGGTLRNVPVGGACRRAGAGNKCRRVGGSSSSSSAGDQQSSTSARAEADAYYHRDLPTAVASPFLSDGFFLPQFDLGLGGAAPAPFSWTSAAVPDFYDGLASPWSDGTLATGVTGAWDNFTGLELTWPPPAGN